MWNSSAQTEAINLAKGKTSSYQNHRGQDEVFIKPNLIKRNKQLVKSQMQSASRLAVFPFNVKYCVLTIKHPCIDKSKSGPLGGNSWHKHGILITILVCLYEM